MDQSLKDFLKTHRKSLTEIGSELLNKMLDQCKHHHNQAEAWERRGHPDRAKSHSTQGASFYFAADMVANHFGFDFNKAHKAWKDES
jgi:hypothetical protein